MRLQKRHQIDELAHRHCVVVVLHFGLAIVFYDVRRIILRQLVCSFTAGLDSNVSDSADRIAELSWRIAGLISVSAARFKSEEFEQNPLSSNSTSNEMLGGPVAIRLPTR